MQQSVLYSSTESNDVFSLGISEIIRDGDFILINFRVKTDNPLKGLQFKLNHIPFQQILDTKEYEYSISYFEDEIIFENCK